MSTLLYLPSNGSPPISPALHSSWEDSSADRLVLGCSISSGDSTLTGPSGAFSPEDVGSVISSVGTAAIPGGTTIVSYTSDSEVEISVGAATNGSGMTVNIASSIVRPFSKTPAGTSLATYFVTKGAATNPFDGACGVFLSDPLDAQTIAGTMEVSVPAYESNNLANAFLQARLSLVDAAGAEQSVLYAGQTATAQTTAATNAATQEFWGTGVANLAVRYLNAALTSQVVTSGWRLMLALGARFCTANTGYQAGLRFGDVVGATDGPAAGNTTGGTAGSLRSWVQLSHTLLYPSVSSGGFEGWGAVSI